MSFDYFSIRRMQYFLEKIKNVLGSAAYKNVPTAGDAGVTQVVLGNDSRLTDARTPVAHNQASNTINAMTGYSKPNATSAIAVSDSLNDAVGKLEKGLDGKTNTWTGTQAEYAAQAAGIPDGTIIDITDDEESVPQIIVVDNLTTQDTTKALSANQGYVLKNLIDNKADILVLHLSEDEQTSDTICDKTPSEVLAAYQADNILVIKDAENDQFYMFTTYSDSTTYYSMKFSSCNAAGGALISANTIELVSSANDDEWDSISVTNAEHTFIIAEIISWYNPTTGQFDSYSCDKNPSDFTNALALNKGLGAFLVDFEYTYSLSYINTTTRVYRFSTIAKDSSDNLTLRTFVLTAASSGDSWESVELEVDTISGGGGASLPIDISSSSNVTGILNVANGGTGNSSGYVRAGQLVNTTIGTCATAEGGATTASGDYSHGEGQQVVASGDRSHAEGQTTYASGANSHAEGNGSSATNSNAHAEGDTTLASGTRSHAEGYQTTASGSSSHAEGSQTEATSTCAHAEGLRSKAQGNESHAEGIDTIAKGDYSHVQGKYNIQDNNNTYAHIVGNGTSSTRSNAHTLDWSGNAWFAGTVTDGTGNVLSNKQDALPTVVNDRYLHTNASTGALEWTQVQGGGGSSATVLGGTLEAGDTQITFTNNAITATAMIDIFTNDDSVGWISRSVSGTTLTLTFPPQSSDLAVRVRLEETGE